MKADAPLDHAAFQLSPKRTRFELFVSGGGETESLVLGLVKPLLTHLPEAAEQVSEAGCMIKLKLPESENEAPWFTKGTLERFVHFISTPEVLEGVNAIHSEMAQLEAARKFHFTLYSQGDGDQLSSVGSSTDASSAGAPAPSKSRREMEVADFSRKELLRAIDVQLMTLHQGLNVAFARATAAGFSVEHVADLMVFAEHFRVSRLRDACAKFLVSCQCRQQEVSTLRYNTDTHISGSNMSIENEAGSETLSNSSSKRNDKSNQNISNISKEDKVSQSSTDLQPEQESFCSSSIIDNSVAKPRVMSTTDNQCVEASPESVGKASSGIEQPTSDNDKQSPATTKRSFVRSSSPRTRRSASPMRRVQIGRSGSRRSNSAVIRSINYFPEPSNKERSSNRESGSSDVDDESGGDNEEAELPKKRESTRRFSVQDAINLFESKQREQRHSTEGFKKHMKVESRRLSSETGNSTTCEKAVLRRWSGAGEIGKPDIQSSVFDHSIQSVINGKGVCQVEATSQTELRPMVNEPGIEERKKVDSRFSSPLKVRESHTMQSGLVQMTGSQYSEASVLPFNLEGSRKVSPQSVLQNKFIRSPEKYQRNDFSADEFPLSQWSETADNFSNTTKARKGEHTDEINQSKRNNELNRHLQEKANQLEAFFAAHKTRNQAVEESSSVPPPVKPPTSMDWKSAFSGVKFEGPSDQEKLYGNIPKEVFQKTDIFTRTKPELDQLMIVQNVGRDSLSNSWSNRMDFDMQVLMNMADSNCANDEEQFGGSINDKPTDELRGKFYDHYREKREAKLREEHTAKRAEKEAKLKAMHEVLERRKAEMSGKSTGSSEKQDPLVQARVRAQKLRSSRSRLSKNKKELQEVDEDDEEEDTNGSHGRGFHRQDLKVALSRPAPGVMPSPTATPRASKDLPKPSVARKISSKSMPAAMARSSIPLTTSSPRSVIPKVSSTSSTSKGRRKTQSPMAENSLSRSVPNFADLKKENTKPSPGWSGPSTTLDNARASSHGQSKGSSRNKGASEASHPDINRSCSGSRSMNGKEGKKNRTQAIRNSCASVSELKSFTTITYEGAILGSKPSFYSKMTKKSSVVPLESKPFLRKGSGIGPGVGPGIAKMKISPQDHASKNIDDEVETGGQNREEIAEELRKLQLSDTLEGLREENEVVQPASDTMETPDAGGDSDISQNNMQVKLVLNKTTDWSEECISDNNCVSDNERTIPTVSPVDNGNVSPSKVASSPNATNGAHNVEITSNSEIIMNEEHAELSMAAASSSPLMDTVSTQFSSSVSRTLDSPLGSPTSLTSQIHHSLSQMLEEDTDAARTRKKWGSAQKPVLIPQQPQKDARKGFKRLLKFGRKSRSETVTIDWVSASALSEGDEDTDELKDPCSRNTDDHLQKGQTQAKGFGPGKPLSDRSYNLGSINGPFEGERLHDPSPTVRSTIPVQPPNLKLREEHLPGATLLKAPRSFFSLSTFRSKGSDSKSR